MKKGPLAIMLGMIVILAISLSTATFAWYSSNNEVSATGTLTATVAGSSNLAIGATINPTPSSMVIGDTKKYVPSCPNGVLSASATASNFWKVTINGDANITDINDSATDDLARQTIFVRNNSVGSDSTTVSVVVNITGELAARIDYALIGVNGQAGADGQTSVANKVYAQSYKYATKPLGDKKGTPASGLVYTELNNTTVESNVGIIKANANVEFVLLVWLDSETVNGDGGKEFTVNVVFTAAA